MTGERADIADSAESPASPQVGGEESGRRRDLRLPACLFMALTAGLATAFALAYFNLIGQLAAHHNVCTSAACTSRALTIIGECDVNSPRQSWARMTLAS